MKILKAKQQFSDNIRSSVEFIQEALLMSILLRGFSYNYTRRLLVVCRTGGDAKEVAQCWWTRLCVQSCLGLGWGNGTHTGHEDSTERRNLGGTGQRGTSGKSLNSTRNSIQSCFTAIEGDTEEIEEQPSINVKYSKTSNIIKTSGLNTELFVVRVIPNKQN